MFKWGGYLFDGEAPQIPSLLVLIYFSIQAPPAGGVILRSVILF
jgi:hypothetical protein